MSVFKAYDIRGTYPDQLDEALAERIGESFVHLLSAKSVAIGRDMREMAPSVMDAFVKGATRAGADVVRVGLSSTPMTYHAIGTLGTDAGVMVTASHNPAGYIGFKFTRKGCVPVSGETGIYEMAKMVEGPRPEPAATPGTVRDENLMEAYLDHVMKFAGDPKPLKVVIDTANGMGGHALPGLLKRLPIEAEVLFGDLDGTFPNHEADPLKVENLKWVAEKVKETGADLGVAFDGDGDRAVFVDERGEPIGADFVTAAIAEDLLEREPKATIVYDLRSSWATRDAIAAAGGTPQRERVGHSFIKATMRETGAAFGGELSGHYYFRDNFVSDSGDIAFVTLLSILSRKNVKLSELVKPYARFFATGEVNFRVEDADERMKALEATFTGGEVDHVDGITVQFEDWWFNVRKSNTEPLLRLNLEAKTEALRDEKRAAVIAVIEGR